jgi:hypothetical protein
VTLGCPAETARRNVSAPGRGKGGCSCNACHTAPEAVPLWDWE